MPYNVELYQFESAVGSFKTPIEYNKTYLNERTKVAIVNAWKQCSVLNSNGEIWLLSEKIHILLRTNKANANYIISDIPDEDKLLNGNKLYIRGTVINKILDESIQNARSLQRENYIRFSELFYRAIRDCDRARLLRAEFYEDTGKTKASLKQKKIKMFNILNDELTGEPLDYQKCEFSHIRSVSLFPELSGLLENGLIVNKKTHTEITKNGINDEKELLQLCKLNNWSIDWFFKYKKLIE